VPRPRSLPPGSAGPLWRPWRRRPPGWPGRGAGRTAPQPSLGPELEGGPTHSGGRRTGVVSARSRWG